MRVPRWLRNTGAGLGLIIAGAACGDGTGPKDPIPIVTSIENVAEIEAGQNLGIAGSGEDNNAVNFIMAYGDGTADTLPVSGNKFTKHFSHTYETPGNYTITGKVIDEEGQSGSANSYVSVTPRRSLYGFLVHEMTDHNVELQQGQLIIDGTPINPQGGVFIAELTEGEHEILYQGANHSNPRQVARLVEQGKLYGERLGWNWDQDPYVPVVLPGRDADIDYFAMKDAFDYILYFKGKTGGTDSLGVTHGRPGYMHSGTCPNVDPSGIEDGEMVINYYFDHNSPHPVTEGNKAQVRSTMNDHIRDIGQGVLFSIRGQEVSSPPSNPYLRITADSALRLLQGGNSSEVDENGCMYDMNYYTPTFRTVDVGGSNFEIWQAFEFNYDVDGSEAWIINQDTQRFSEFTIDGMAVQVAYGPGIYLFKPEKQ